MPNNVPPSNPPESNAVSDDASITLSNQRTSLKDYIATLTQKEIIVTQPPEENIVLQLLMKIPLIASLINRFKVGGDAVYTLATFDNRLAYKEVVLPKPIGNLPIIAGAYQNIGLIASVTNTAMLPLLYFATRALGKPAPIKLTALAQWIYGLIGLILMLAAILFPPAAPVIAIVLTVLGFAASIYFLNRFSNEKTAAIKEAILLKKEIALLENTYSQQLGELQQQIETITTRLPQASKEQLEKDKQTLEQFQSMLAIPHKQLTSLVNKKIELEEEIKTMDDAALLDKSVSVSLGAVAIIGLVLSFIAPPVGFGMLNTVFIMGVTYGLGRMATPAIVALKKYVASHFDKRKEDGTVSESVRSNHIKTQPLFNEDGKSVPPTVNPNPAHPNSQGIEYPASAIKSPKKSEPHSEPNKCPLPNGRGSDSPVDLMAEIENPIAFPPIIVPAEKEKILDETETSLKNKPKNL